METVVHQVRDLGGSERSAAEQLVGHSLGEDQTLVIQVVNCGSVTNQGGMLTEQDALPEWCNVYAGMTDEQIAALEQAISRRLDLTRAAM